MLEEKKNEFKKSIKEIFKSPKEVISFFLPIIVAIIFIIPLPYYIRMGGGIIPLENKIQIKGEGKNGYYGALYVRESKAVVLTYLASYVFPSFEREKIENVTVDNEDETSYNYREKLYFTSSLEAAKKVAYEKAGKKVKVSSSKYTIIYIDKDNKTELKVGDEILSINNKKVNNYDSILDNISNSSKNGSINIEVLRDNKKINTVNKYIDIEGEKKLGIVVSNQLEYKVDPSTVNIRIYDKNSVNKEVSTDIIHKDNLDSKLNIEGIVLDRDNVIVKGASHRLEEVAVVKAIIDIDKMSNIKVGTIPMYEVPLIAYDAEGNKLDVEIVPSVVNASIKISSPSKEIPIKLMIEGELDGVAVKSLKSSVEKVTVYGNQETINTIESLPVSVDVTGVKENKTYEINLSKPTGIREISVKKITVKLEVGGIISRDIEGIPIDAINHDGYSVQVIGEQNRTVTVIVNGSEDVVKNIEPASIRAYVDLAGLSEGERLVEVKVEGDNSTVTYTPRVKEIRVKITKNK